jgi:hypothetical protein
MVNFSIQNALIIMNKFLETKEEENNIYIYIMLLNPVLMRILS